MKNVLGIILSLWATAGVALDGGNSSGGDESPWAYTIPYDTARSTIVGVVDTITQGTPNWKVTFSKTFLAHGTSVEIVAPPAPAYTPKAGSILFARGKSEPYSSSRVVDSTPERETAITEYLFEADPKARLEWADRYAKSKDSYLAHSALAEVEIQSKGKAKDAALTVLVNNPNLAQFHDYFFVATKYLPHPDALAILKPIVLDAKQFLNVRWSVMYAIVWRKDKAFRDLVEAWKDGREGADQWLQDEAKKAWDKIYDPQPKP